MAVFPVRKISVPARGCLRSWRETTGQTAQFGSPGVILNNVNPSQVM
jgi:hypothetical protein